MTSCTLWHTNILVPISLSRTLRNNNQEAPRNKRNPEKKKTKKRKRKTVLDHWYCNWNWIGISIIIAPETESHIWLKEGDKNRGAKIRIVSTQFPPNSTAQLVGYNICHPPKWVAHWKLSTSTLLSSLFINAPLLLLLMPS